MTVKELLETELNAVQNEYERIEKEIYYAELSLAKLKDIRFSLGNQEEELFWVLQELYGDE